MVRCCVGNVINIFGYSFIMVFTLDNTSLLYLIIILFVVQFFIMRYYTTSVVEDCCHKNNRKIVKKLSSQISTTFDQYMGNRSGGSKTEQPKDQDRKKHKTVRINETVRPPVEKNDADSVEDPADSVDKDDQIDREQPDEHEGEGDDEGDEGDD